MNEYIVALNIYNDINRLIFQSYFMTNSLSEDISLAISLISFNSNLYRFLFVGLEYETSIAFQFENLFGIVSKLLKIEQRSAVKRKTIGIFV